MEDKQTRKKQTLSRILSNNLFLLKIAFKEAPYFTFFQLASVAKNRVIVFVEHVYMIGYVIDAIIKGRPFWEVALFIGIVFVVITLWCNIWGVMVGFKIAPVATERINKRIRTELYKKAAAMDLKCYDDPDFYNDFVWAMGEAATRVYQVMQSVASIIGSIISIALVGGYMISQDHLGILVVLVSFIGVFLLSKERNKRKVKVREAMRPAERKRDYISRVFYLPDHAGEIRLTHVKDKLYQSFNEACNKLDDTAKKRSKPLMTLSFIIDFVFSSLLINGLYLLHLLYRAIVEGTIGYGVMVTLYKSCGMIEGSFRMLASAIPELQEHSLYIEKIRGFLDYEITVKSLENILPFPEQQEILHLKNVSFSYGDKNVLNNINLTIRPGEKIALVGYNGAGKTTLIKLLMRLYDVSEGEILYGLNNIKEYDLTLYRNYFETVFQDYQLFASSIADNITMDIVKPDCRQLNEAAKKGGLYRKIQNYDKGYDTQVTKEFDDDGVLLSGGEAQSLVISRAFYKDNPIIILDEPSGALDPIAEYNLNRTILTLGKTKTVIIISHRLSTTKSVDKIYMLESGSIIEQGSHDELMAQNGKYAEMFRLQAEKYNAEAMPEKYFNTEQKLSV